MISGTLCQVEKAFMHGTGMLAGGCPSWGVVEVSASPLVAQDELHGSQFAASLVICLHVI